MDKSKLVPVRAIPTGIATPKAKAAIEVNPVIPVVMMSPVSTIKMLLPTRLTFFASFSLFSTLCKKYALISETF